MNIKSVFRLSLTSAALVTSMTLGQGAIIAGWSAFDTSVATFPVAASSLGANVSSASIASPVSLGKVPDPNFSLGDIGSGAWNTSSTVNTGQYLQLDVQIAGGYSANFSSLQFNGYQDSTALNLHVRSSADNYAADIGTITLTGSTATHSVNLSSLTAQTGTLHFRVYGTDGAASVWLFGVNGGSVTGGGFLALNGTVSAVPEPEQYAVAFGLGLVGFAVWRRRFTRKA